MYRSTPALVAAAFGLALAACSTDGDATVPSDAAELRETASEPATARAEPKTAGSASQPVAEPAGTRPVERPPIPKADPPPPLDVIGVQDQLGMAWAGQVYHKDRMRWEAPDPLKDYFVIVVRELTPHHEALGLEAGKAYRYRGMNEYEYIRDVDLSLTNDEIARTFGAFQDKPIDVLMSAAEADDVETVRRLLAEGMSPETRNRSERPVLLVASKKGSLDVVRALIDAGARIDLADVAGETALHQAARGGHVDVVTYLLEHGAELEGKDRLGHTALYFAAEANSPEVARVLIERGADVELEDKRGYSPLAYARVFLRSRMKPELRELLTPKE